MLFDHSRYPITWLVLNVAVQGHMPINSYPDRPALHRIGMQVLIDHFHDSPVRTLLSERCRRQPAETTFLRMQVRVYRKLSIYEIIRRSPSLALYVYKLLFTHDRNAFDSQDRPELAEMLPDLLSYFTSWDSSTQIGRRN
jgi:hypothetical protein